MQKHIKTSRKIGHTGISSHHSATTMMTFGQSPGKRADSENDSPQ